MFKSTFLTFLLSILTFITAKATTFTYTFEGQTLIYEVLDEDAKTCQVYTSLNMRGKLTIPETVVYNEIQYTVISITDLCFNNQSNLTSIVIPNSVTAIGDHAFSNCSSLTTINLPNSVNTIGDYAFSLCSSLTSVNIPNSVTVVGDYTFYKCSSLTTINIPNSVTTIGSSAFSYCSSITSIDIPNSVTAIGDHAFSNCSSLTTINLPNSVTAIGSYAVANCTSITSIVIPNSVTAIGDWTFYNCSSLTSVNIPNSVTAIGDYAFSDCSSLTSVNIPNSVTAIGNHTFYKCSSLTSIDIPNSVTAIGDYSFAYCTQISHVYIPKSVIEIGRSSFYECSGLVKTIYPIDLYFIHSSNIIDIRYPRDCFIDDKGIIFNNDKTSIYYVPESFEGVYKVDDTVKEIRSNAFNGCKSITEIIIPENVTDIGSKAFSECTSISTLEFNAINCVNGSFPSSIYKLKIGNQVTRIPDNFLSGCGINELQIPNSVTCIGQYAFFKNTNLNTVFIPNSVRNVGDYAFYDCTGLIKTAHPDCISNPFLNGVNTYYPTECYIDESGIVYDNNRTAIYYAPLTLSDGYEIPNTVECINDYAFYGCKSLKYITIPENVTKIGYKSFTECSALTSLEFNAINCNRGEFPSTISNLKIGDKVTVIPYKFIVNSSIRELNLPNSLTTIEDYAFFNNTYLKEVFIPNSVTSVGMHAFGACDLTRGAYPKHLSNPFGQAWGTFSYPSDGILGEDYIIYNADRTKLYDVFYNTLDHYTIPETVTEIYKNAFSYCNKLINMEIPENVTYIGESAFNGCTSLSNITLSKNLVEIGESVFKDCSSLKSITIPENVTNIGDNAFIGCTSLESLEFNAINCIKGVFPSTISMLKIGDKVTRIPDNFLLKSSIEELTIPNSVITIGHNAFKNNDKIKYLLIPNSVVSVEDDAFYYCTALTMLIYPDNLQIPHFNSSVRRIVYAVDVYVDDYGVIYNGERSIVYYAPESLEDGYKLPTTVNVISDCAFINCKNLTSINIPQNVTSIGKQAFYNCSSITSVSIPENVTNIGYLAFAGCTSLKSIIIPENVTSMDNSAFASCNSLENIEYNAINCNINNLNTEGTTIFPPSVKTVTFGNKVSKIPDYFLSNGCAVEELILPTSLTAIGKESFKNNKLLKEICIPENVTEIGIDAFSGCNAIEDIEFNAIDCNINTTYDNGETITSVFPNTVKTLNFWGKVTKISDHFLGNGSKLEELILPDSLKTIGHYAFNNSNLITQITIPEKVEVFGANAFSGWDALEKVDFNAIFVKKVYASNDHPRIFPSNVKEIIFGKNVLFIPPVLFGLGSNIKKVDIPESVEGIGIGAFQNNTNLTSISIPENVIWIGDNAFTGCSSLIRLEFNAINCENAKFPQNIAYLKLGNKVTKIPDSFLDGSTIKELIIPASVDTIGQYAFQNNKGIQDVFIPTSIKSIGYHAFYGCDLIRAMYPDNIENPFNNNIAIAYPADAYIDDYGVIYNRSREYVYYAPNTITGTYNILPTVKEVKYATFFNCGKISGIVIPQSVTSIGDNAFKYCDSLVNLEYNAIESTCEKNSFPATIERLTIGDKVKVIPNNFLANGNKIQRIIIPNSVTSIGNNAFVASENLKTLVVGTNVASIGSSISNLKTIWMSPNPPVGVKNVTGIINYVPNNNYTFANSKMYPLLSSSFLVDDVLYTPVSVADRTCDLLDGGYPAEEYDLTVDEKVSYKGIEFEICNIGDYAFSKDTNLNSVALNYNGSMGKEAFSYSTNIKNLNIGAKTKEIGEWAFKNCIGLTDINIPDNVTILGSGCFSNCISVNGINLGSGITELAKSSFEGCTSLDKISIPNNISIIGDDVFKGCNSLKELRIENYEMDTNPYKYTYYYSGFNYYKETNSYDQNNERETIYRLHINPGDKLHVSGIFRVTGYPGSGVAIVYCNDAEIMGLYSNFDSEYIFKECGDVNLKIYVKVGFAYPVSGSANLQIFDLSLSGESNYLILSPKCGLADSPIENYYVGRSLYSNTALLNGCSSLINVEIGGSRDAIYDSEFAGCTSLKNVKIGDSVTAISANAFKDCVSLPSIKIGNSVKSIGNQAFSGCTGLNSVQMSNSITSVGDQAFQNCTGLTAFDTDNGVETIGQKAFEGCENMEYFMLGENVKSIGALAFSDFINIKELYSKAPDAPVCGSLALDNINKWDCTLFVPAESISKYKIADQWKDFFFMKDITEGGYSSVDKVMTDDPETITEVYNLNGVKIADSLEGLSTGIYIVRQGNMTRKVAIK